MDLVEIKQSLRNILISVLKHDSFEMSDDLTASNVKGWDSLSHMIIINEIEKHFSIKFKLKELNKVKNIGQLTELIKSKL